MTLISDSLTDDGGHDLLMNNGEQPNTDPLMEDGEHDSLISHGGQASAYEDSLMSNGGPDPLMIDGELRIAGVDWDKPRSVRISFKDKDIFGLSPGAFIDWYRAGADGADMLCFERPHLRPRGEFSRAQIWTENQLELLVDGPPILMPNGKKLRKMAIFAGNVKERTVDGKKQLFPIKDLDSESIRKYAEAFPHVRDGWKLFVPPSQDQTRLTYVHRDALRYEIGRTINEWRELWQDVTGKEAIRELPFIAPAAAILDAKFDDLSDNCKDIFKLTRSRGTVNLSMGKTRIMTVYAMVFSIDNKLRTYNGRPLGRRYLIKDVIGLCDSYMPNMARSNLTGYGKTGVASVDRRNGLNSAVKELITVFQEA